MGEYSYPLSTFIAPEKGLAAANNLQEIQISEPETKYFSNVYTLTFVLRRNKADSASIEATPRPPIDTAVPVLIRYIIVIYPPLQWEDLP